MKKSLIIIAIATFAATSASAGTIRVYNNDSKTHTVKLKCSGSSKSFDIKASTTASYTFHSSAKECDIVGGSVKFPGKTLKDGAKFKIKDGKAKAN